MGHRPFSKPVILKLHPVGNFEAKGPGEAAQYLEQFWPAGRSAHYRQAKVLCHAAVDGIVEPETARIALVEAARRAGALTEGNVVDGVVSDTTSLTGDIAWIGQSRDAAAELEVTDTDLVGYYRASDILADPAISPSRKRALLAYWASDLHAVASSPSLRSIRGVTITIDSILDALCSLDAEVDQAAMTSGTAAAVRSW